MSQSHPERAGTNSQAASGEGSWNPLARWTWEWPRQAHTIWGGDTAYAAFERSKGRSGDGWLSLTVEERDAWTRAAGTVGARAMEAFVAWQSAQDGADEDDEDANVKYRKWWRDLPGQEQRKWGRAVGEITKETEMAAQEEWRQRFEKRLRSSAKAAGKAAAVKMHKGELNRAEEEQERARRMAERSRESAECSVIKWSAGLLEDHERAMDEWRTDWAPVARKCFWCLLVTSMWWLAPEAIDEQWWQKAGVSPGLTNAFSELANENWWVRPTAVMTAWIWTALATWEAWNHSRAWPVPVVSWCSNEPKELRPVRRWALKDAIIVGLAMGCTWAWMLGAPAGVVWTLLQQTSA